MIDRQTVDLRTSCALWLTACIIIARPARELASVHHPSKKAYKKSQTLR